MRRVSRLTLSLAIVVATAVPLYAQATPIQFTPTPAVAATCQNVNGAINTQQTLTITVPSGQFAYILEIDGQAANNATATAGANQKFTSTNLNSTSGGLWSAQYSIPATANTFAQVGPFHFSPPLKSAQAGVNVTIVSPAAAAQTQFNINSCFFTAP